MEFNVFFSRKLIFTTTSLKKAEICKQIYQQTGISGNNYYMLHKGKLWKDDDPLVSDIHCELRMLGGKGGFGSMLRAIGAQIEKTTNREACRDLSGRRLRDINEEKRLKAWLEKKSDREDEIEEKRKRKLEKLVAVPKHVFKDSEYENARSELTEKVSEAVEEGFKKAALNSTSTTSLKRKATDTATIKAKKPALWIADDLSSGTDSDSSSSTQEG